LIAADPDAQWKSADLWRNGERVGRVIERRIESGVAGREGATLSLIATPPAAIEHAPAIYAAIMRDATLSAIDAERTQCRTTRP
jgi:hypothetical protein